MSVSCAAGLVIRVPRRQTCQVQVSDLLAAGCNLRCTHIGILTSRLLTEYESMRLNAGK